MCGVPREASIRNGYAARKTSILFTLRHLTTKSQLAPWLVFGAPYDRAALHSNFTNFLSKIPFRDPGSILRVKDHVPKHFGTTHVLREKSSFVTEHCLAVSSPDKEHAAHNYRRIICRVDIDECVKNDVVSAFEHFGERGNGGLSSTLATSPRFQNHPPLPARDTPSQNATTSCRNSRYLRKRLAHWAFALSTTPTAPVRTATQLRTACSTVRAILYKHTIV